MLYALFHQSNCVDNTQSKGNGLIGLLGRRRGCYNHLKMLSAITILKMLSAITTPGSGDFVGLAMISWGWWSRSRSLASTFHVEKKFADLIICHCF